MDELKPCPFCGSRAEVREHSFPLIGVRYGVICMDEPKEGCDMWQDTRAKTRAEAIDTWNRRPSCPECREKDEALRAAVRKLHAYQLPGTCHCPDCASVLPAPAKEPCGECEGTGVFSKWFQGNFIGDEPCPKCAGGKP